MKKATALTPGGLIVAGDRIAPYDDIIMPSTDPKQNRVRVRRLARQWSQAELAARAGISRTAVSAIEGERLVPSVTAALLLATVLECTVEELFSTQPTLLARHKSPQWAWGGATESSRYWCGSVQGQLLYYPAEITALGEIPHDGTGLPSTTPARIRRAEETLVMASCDPAAGLLARLYERATGFRLLVFPRSSRQALELLEAGLVHVAGVHLSSDATDKGNLEQVRQSVTKPTRLVRVASWQDGIAVGSNVTAPTVRGLLRDRVTWIGREAGSGARQCLDELLQDKPAPRRMARDHRGVADAIRCGWADAGICLQLVAEEAGLRFLPIRTEGYDLCYQRANEEDPRVLALVGVIQSPEFQELLGELPGYDTRDAGHIVDTA